MLESNLKTGPDIIQMQGHLGLALQNRFKRQPGFQEQQNKVLPEAEKRFNAVQAALSAHKYEVLKKQVLSFLLITKMAIYL